MLVGTERRKKMEKQTLLKANELNKEIEELAKQITKLKYEISKKKEYDEKMEKGYYRYVQQFAEKFFEIIWGEEKVNLHAHYELSNRIQLDADEQLVDLILKYLEDKKERLEKEFKSME